MPGRTPQKNARRMNARPDWVMLPEKGYSGRVPDWPIGEPTDAQSALWVELWRTPQAHAWSMLGWTRSVARYAALVVLCEGPKMSAALLAELRQMEDRLGLSPMSMRRLQWEVGTPAKVGEQATGNVVELFG